MSKKEIAVLEDYHDIRNLISKKKKKNHYLVDKFADAASLFDFLRDKKPDLLILDLMLPDMDGIDVCSKIRNNKRLVEMPIIMLTAKSEEMDKILGLEMGADDYMTKPFSPRELIARIKAVLRRSSNNKTEEDLIIVDNKLVINLHKFTVRVDEKAIKLTTTEFKILALLAKRKGWVYSRNKILDYLYGSEKMVMDRTVDVHIRNLRKKLQTAGKYIKNIRGIGYKLEE